MNQSDSPATKPRIAILSPFYYPELISTGKVNTLLGNELVRQGWEVEVICSHPLYPKWQPTVSDATLPSTRFFRGGGNLHYSEKPFLRRLMLEGWFLLHCIFAIPKLHPATSVALMVYPPSLFGLAANIMLKKKVRRVALVHDLQGVYSHGGYHSGSQLLTRVINAVERRCVKGANRCIFFSNEIARTAQESFALNGDNMFVQYPFVTIDPDTPVTNELEGILPSGKQHVIYSGALGEKQNPRVLFDMMEKAAAANPAAMFHIFSSGPNFDALCQKASTNTALHFHELVAENQLTELYARSAVQIIPQAPGTEHGSLPSKLPNILAAGVHILGVCGESSEVAQLIRQTNTGTVVPEWTEEQFLSGVQEALTQAATVSVQTRRARSASFLAQCEVASLAHLVVG